MDSMTMRRRIIMNTRPSELPGQYTRIAGIVFDGNSWFVTDYHMQGSDTLDFTYLATANGNVLGTYTATTSDDNYSYYHTNASTGSYIRYDGTLKRYKVSHDQDFHLVMMPDGCTVNGTTAATWTAQSFTSEEPLWIGMLPNSTAASLKGRLVGEIIVPGRFKAIPCKRKADNEIGYYDPYSKTFYVNQGTGTVTEYTS